MRDLPKSVHIFEVGPREGFQFEPPNFSTAQKVELIEALAQTGLPEIECVSFVNPKYVPQMADAQAIAESITRRENVKYSCMWLNEKGFQQAQNSGLDLPALTSTSASDSFLLKNNNRTPERQHEEQRALRRVYSESGLGRGPIYIFTAFGCNYQGEVTVEQAMLRTKDMVEICEDAGTPPLYITLCDTVGAADPKKIRDLVDAVRTRWPEYPVALHLHDTRGLGIANAMAGLELGVSRFDTSVGGMGGCPFAGNPAAAGNIVTEELVLLCERLGVDTGVRLDELIDVSRRAEAILGHSLPSKLAKAGVFKANP